MNTSILEQMAKYFREDVSNFYTGYAIELLNHLSHYVTNNPTRLDYKNIIRSHNDLIGFINTLGPKPKSIMSKYTKVSTAHYQKMMVPALIFLSTE